MYGIPFPSLNFGVYTSYQSDQIVYTEAKYNLCLDKTINYRALSLYGSEDWERCVSSVASYQLAYVASILIARKLRKGRKNICGKFCINQRRKRFTHVSPGSTDINFPAVRKVILTTYLLVSITVTMNVDYDVGRRCQCVT